MSVCSVDRCAGVASPAERSVSVARRHSSPLRHQCVFPARIAVCHLPRRTYWTSLFARRIIFISPMHGSRKRNKWSVQVDIRPHCRSRRTVQSYSPGGGNVPSRVWRHLANTIELVLPWAYPSSQPKRKIDRFSRFCTAHGIKFLYFTMDIPFLQNCPVPWGTWTTI